MAINYRELRSLSSREMIAALTRDGFVFVRQIGSHKRYHILMADGSARFLSENTDLNTQEKLGCANDGYTTGDF